MLKKASLPIWRANTRLRELSAVLLPMLVLLAPARSLYAAGVNPQDEGTVLAYPDLVLHGAVPNLDFESVYGPGNLFVVAGAYALGGHSVAAERTVGLIYRLLVCLALYYLLRPSGRWRACLGAAIAAAAMVYVLGYVASAWFGGLAFGLWSVALLVRRPGSRRLIPAVAGALAGIALGMRPDLVAALALGSALSLKRLGWSARWSYVAGLAVGLVPTVVNAAQAGPRRVFTGEIFQPLFVFPAGRRLPLGAIAPPAMADAVAAVLVILGLLLMARTGVGKPDSGERGRVQVAIALFSLGLVPYFTSRADEGHAVSAFVIPLASSVLLMTRMPRSLWSRTLLPAVAVFSVIMVCGESAHDYYWQVRQSASPSMAHLTVGHDGRTVPVGDATHQAQVQELLRHIDDTARATSATSIFIGPADLSKAPYGDTYLYFLLPRLHPSSFYLEMEPGVANVGDRLARDLQHTDLVVTSSTYLAWNEPNDIQRSRSQSANAELSRHFRLVWDSAPWRVYVRTGTRAAARSGSAPSP